MNQPTVARFVLLAAVSAACSTPEAGPNLASVGPGVNTGGGGNVGDGATVGDGSDGSDGTGADSVSSDGVLTDGDGAGGDASYIGQCACTNLQCGKPGPTCSNDCGKCGAGLMCIKNKCVADEKCKCQPGACDVLPGCVDSCGECPVNQQCNNNFCVASCKCSGIECGPPPGCEKSCGDCKDLGPGLLCTNNQCVADPKCKCSPGVCGTPAGCGKDCGGCPPGLKCNGNQCINALDCNCDNIECGFPHPSCPSACKACGSGKVCQNNKCVPMPACKAGEPCNRKFGEVCGPIAQCVPPPAGSPQTGQNLYKACLNKQCETGNCQGGYCTKTCKIGKDQIDDNTGAGKPDGIEDPGGVSECGDAKDGPNGVQFVCVEQAGPLEVAQGSSNAVCAPGGKLKPCKASAECPKSEVCRLYNINGDWESRCGPRQHNAVGSNGALGSQWCNENPAGTPPQPIMLCENNICGDKGCIDLCQSDADCATQPGQCKSGKCITTGKTCIVDGDCPKWTCKDGIALVATSATVFKACQP